MAIKQICPMLLKFTQAQTTIKLGTYFYMSRSIKRVLNWKNNKAQIIATTKWMFRLILGEQDHGCYW